MRFRFGFCLVTGTRLIYEQMNKYIYIYIYIYMCVCVCGVYIQYILVNMLI